MGSQTVTLDSEAAEGKSQSLHELVSYLKSAFRPIDFDAVESVLASREETYRRENKRVVSDLTEALDKYKSELEVVLQKNAELALDKCVLEDKLRRVRAECEISAGTVLRLREQNKLVSDREKRATEKCENLLKSCQKPSQPGESVSDLKEKIRDLKFEKERAEAELEACSKKFEELRARVVRLEADTADLLREEEADSPTVRAETAVEASDGSGNAHVLVGGESNFHVLSQLKGGLKKKEAKSPTIQAETAVKTSDSNGNSHILVGGESSQVKGGVKASAAGIHFAENSHIKEEKESAPQKNGRNAEKQVGGEEACANKKMSPFMLQSCQPVAGCIIDITGSDSDDDNPTICRIGGPSSNLKGTASQNFENTLISDEVNVKSGCKVDVTSSCKRKWDSLVNSSKSDEDTQTSNHTLKPLQGLIHESNLVSSQCNSVFLASSSGRNNAMKSATHSTRSTSLEKAEAEPKSSNRLCKIVYSSSSEDSSSDSEGRSIAKRIRKWDSEVEMIFAFNKYPEICLEAVCALYRQNIHVEKPVLGQGFSKPSVDRVSSLAEFLIDGDPHCKLKKSMQELEKYDADGVRECTRLATWYSKQLFDIYSKKRDPLFLPL